MARQAHHPELSRRANSKYKFPNVQNNGFNLNISGDSIFGLGFGHYNFEN
jgi:hypothetical protein